MAISGGSRSFPCVIKDTLERYFYVELEKYKNIEDVLRNLWTLLEHLMIITNTVERKELPCDMKTETEHIIPSTDKYVLQEYLYTLDTDNFFFYLSSEKSLPIRLFYLITYPWLVTSKKETRNKIFYEIEHQILYLYFPSEKKFLQNLSVYNKDNPNDIYTHIHTIWKYEPKTELKLKLAYCKELMEAKDYKTLIQLIHHHADYFIESFEFIKPALGTTTTTILLHILHHQVTLYKAGKVKTNETTVSRTIVSNHSYLNTILLVDGFDDFIRALDNTQILCTPYLIKLLQPVMKEQPVVYLEIILLCSDRLRQANHYTECIKFIKSHFQFISSFPIFEWKLNGCFCRKQYCVTLLLLLDEYITCQDTHKMNLVLTKLLEIRASFLSDIHSNSCYCFMGFQECWTLKERKMYEIDPFKLSRHDTYFKKELLNCYRRRLYGNKCPRVSQCSKNMVIHSEYAYELQDFNLVMNKVIQGELNPTPYLQSMTDVLNQNYYKNDSVMYLMEFIKRSADHNIASIYNIIKTLGAFHLKPEIQNLILQELTHYLMISCNRQYGLLSKFILDISMICPNNQFSRKLISGIATLSLKFDDDTVNDFRKIIYKCYCIVRHGSKHETDTNITKYKNHYTFIELMEAEDEMKKLTSLTNLLLMLTLLFIASGGHHKSAELKKYLSLKYEYRDSILYLLWCSGDVEINPGPTRFTLRKLDDSEKERNWIYDMCSILVTLIKYKSKNRQNGGMWQEKPLHWPTDCLFYDPKNKPKGSGYSIDTDKKLLECLEEHCNREKVFKETTQFDDEHTKLKVKQYQKEIITWKNNRSELFEQYIWRQELDALKAAKGSLHKYRKDSECNLRLYDINLKLIFSSGEDSNRSRKSYTGIVRDIAATFCRIGKGLNYLEKSPGIWKTPPRGWNPSHPYYSPSNDKKGRHKGQDDKLVDNLLTYCESNNITIPSELQPLIMAWKRRKTPEITKSYTIWSKTAIVKHSLQYLELEGMLGKIHVQESLKQIGVILDKQHWKCQKITSTDNDDKSQDSGLSNTSHSSLCTVNTTTNRTNSSPKILSFQTIQDNQLKKFTNSTNANMNAACDSSYCYDSHENDHVCHTEFNLDNQWNQSSKHTRVSSCRDSCSILTRETQSEADDKHHPISAINSSNSKYQLISSESNLNEQLIPSTVYIHDDTSKPERKSNNISKTAKKRHRQNNDESCSEPKRLHVSEEDLPLFLQVLTSSSDNGKDIANTSPKGNSNDCKITSFSTDHLSHDSISIKSKPNLPASGKQTDQLVINKLPDTTDGKPVDSSSYTQADNENKKGETTSDQCVNQIVNLLEEIEQDYSATVVEPSSGQTSSHRSSNGEIDKAVKNIQTTSDLDYNVKEMINLLEELDPVFISNTLETHKLSPYSLPDQSSDYSDELPDHVESIIDELLNSNDTNNTFDLMNGS